MLIMLSKRIFMLVLIILVSFVFGACSSNSSQSEASYAMVSLAGMPLEIQNAPEVVKTAYQFAVANPEVLTELPCYCGCGGMGHTSNYSCYVSGEHANRSLAYDNHALGCSICVDITLDAMRMLDEGKTLPEIRSYVDQTYSQFGPSNIP
jgi:hypothetical protein